MGLFNKFFGKKEVPIQSYEDFWNWFKANAPIFFETVRSGKNIQEIFFDKLSPSLKALNEGFFFLTGMLDENTVELVITPDGTIKNIVFAEELVQTAPDIVNWKFIALKSAMDIDRLGIKMSALEFNKDNISFYSISHDDYPDEVDIVVAYSEYNEENSSTIINGIYIFLDNYLGELYSATAIDNIRVISKAEAEQELIPISKLKDYLIWREKEFVEKYSGIRYNTENDAYSSLEAELENGLPLIAIVNSSLIDWDSKASHPWILKISITYDGKDNNGMPGNETYELLNKLEDDAMLELKDSDGYLNIGRETGGNERRIYFACTDFRKPSKITSGLMKKYAGRLDIEYDIFKDKYWQSLERFRGE